MNKIILLFLLLCCSFVGIYADNEQIVLRDSGNQHNHFDQPILFDQPDVFLDTDNFAIIIDGGGEVAYYDVEIESMTTWLTVISTQVSGTYDTIDVSSLATGDYIITITSPTGNEFEGFFEIE
jgi:hypothetical protein